MAETVAGFELPDGVAADDLEHWKPFAQWFQDEYGFEPHPRDSHDKAIFEAFLAGAYYEFEARTMTASAEV